MTPPYYILDAELREVRVGLIQWAKWFETANRTVGADFAGPYWISTVFLGLDHNFFKGPPLLYETMIFKRINDENMVSVQLVKRYSTWTEADEGHIETLNKVKEGKLPNDDYEETD